MPNIPSTNIVPPYLLSSLSPVTLAESLQLLKSQHTTKSSPTDIVPSYLLKSCPNLFAEILTEIANRSFTQGVFPSSFKIAQISPLLKKPSLDPDQPSSYRPISNLVTFGKLLERIVLSRIRPHFLASPNYSNLQSAYRPLHSTETAMLKVTNDLLISAGSSSTSLLVTLDLSAAFDTVNHKKLLDRLESEFGITGGALVWFSSYLSGRQQFVKVGSAVTSNTTSDQGVPQGSVLGPLLFGAYVAPVSRVIDAHGIHHHSYADDLTLYMGLGTEPCVSRDKVLACANDVGIWFMLNDLEVNASKSEVTEIGTEFQRKKYAPQSSYTIAGANITPVDSVKIVGVTIDKNLSFEKHISGICSSCAMQTKALRHIRPFLDIQTANTIACSTILSRLDYCNSILSGISSHNIARLQRAQNNAVKVVCAASRHVSSKSLLLKLHWLPVQQRIHFKVALLTFKTLEYNTPSYLRSLLSVYEPTRSLRSSGQNQLTVSTDFNKTVLACRAFQNYAPKLWNSLPKSLRAQANISKNQLVNNPTSNSITSINMFKRGLKTVLFHQAFEL